MYMFGDDLLNPNFNCGAEPGEPSCILDSLCTIHDGIIQEVKSIREHWWKPYIKSSIEKKLLRGHEDGSLLGILDTAHFDTNSKNLRKDYETYVLSIGEYDERVFLGEEAPLDMEIKLMRELGERMLPYLVVTLSARDLGDHACIS